MVRKARKSYETPTRGWQQDRIDQETDVLYDYGLKNKREVWKSESKIRDFRREARKLNATEDEEREQQLINKLHNLGLVTEDADLTDVLDLDLEDILERRLQTIVYEKGLANTMKQARQFITHGHIMIEDNVVDVPSYLVTTEEENNINVAPGSKEIVQE
ncbi:MAG: 30S ribosomal protein S4 [Candidatus Nanohaloarchaeota archaeon QJJ-5]|nr:30S ribosomal protein S4 [Candidatus Nanohaloarchaeota archaeon QJJ-5]